MRARYCFCLLVLLMPFASADAETPAEQLEELLNDSWEFNLNESPTFATRVGDKRLADKLASMTLEDCLRRIRKKREFLKRAERIDRAALEREQQINYDIFVRLLKDEIAEGEFKTYLTPITNRWGFHIWLPELPKQVPLNDAQDFDNYISRLEAFGRYADEHIALMQMGIDEGFSLPSVALEGFEETITPHIVEDPTKSLLYAPLNKLPARISASDATRLRESAKEAIKSSVVPAYERFYTFMTKKYLPKARGSIGASALPRGREYYRHCVRKFTTLDVTPEQVHETGLSEVKRIRAEMGVVIKKTGFEAFVEHLRTDPKFYADSPEQLQKEIAFVLKVMDGKLPKLFKRLPRTPYGIREVPAYVAPRTTAAYYSLPKGDGTQAGYYYINTYNLKSRPLYQIEALSLHEAVPGHHLQLALQQELTDLPKFRRFAGFTVFVEGWALYAERLGLEVGFYEDPYSDFGRLSYEMWRACRLVVDTGMHYLGWTRRQAIQFMSDNTALSQHNIVAEIDRYISWPGQALAYKTGEMKIRELRKRAEEQMGDRFDVREFHDVVLRYGSVPLSVLEENVERYIKNPPTE